ncbi:MAG TPA: ABC transporter permease subunit [Verrucomicrobiae bacterium]|jgi:ABC-type transport system involved in cytochrome c biogenesis permease component|nr:ABC transporter permease subunit [Verrucomicrobiae bacterium]
MTFLPIVERELRLASRRRFTYFSRTIAALIAIGLGMFVYNDSPGSTGPEQQGRNIFQTLSWLAFIYAFCAGTATADCISEEKREGTLGLLFLTDLKGYDVVIGKLFATSLNRFYGLVSIFPVLAIPLLMGGVTQGEFWRTALVLANTCLFSLCAGMFVSSISKYPRKAMSATLVLLGIFAFGFPLFQGWTSRGNAWPRLNHFFEIGTPDSAMVYAPDIVYKTSKDDFWLSVAITQGTCWLMLALASFIVPRSWQDKAASSRKNSLGVNDLNGAERHAVRTQQLDSNAFSWLAGRGRFKHALIWLVLIGYAGLWLWGAAAGGRDWTSVYGFFLTAVVLNTTLKIWVTSEAGYRLGQDRKSGALELLLSTTLTVPDILRGQMLALRRQFLWPVITILVTEGLLLLAGIQQESPGADETVGSVCYAIGITVMLFADLYAMSAMAMWVSLTTKNPNRTTGIVLRWMLLFPWVLIIISLLIFSQVGRSEEWLLFLVIYMVVGLGVDLKMGFESWGKLHDEFRTRAVQRYTPPVSIWSRLRGDVPETVEPASLPPE